MIIEYLNELLKGRGVFPSFLVISSWSYVIILIVILICQLFLFLIRKKYYNDEFNSEKHNESKEDEND